MGGTRLDLQPTDRRRLAGLLDSLRLAAGLVAARLAGDPEAGVRRRRRLAFELLQGEAEEVTFERDGLMWAVPAGDRGVGMELFVVGSYQLADVRAVFAWLGRQGRLGESRSVAIDLGANLGTTAIALGREMGLQVLAVEPVPATFAYLRRNVERNLAPGRVTCIEAAVSGRPRPRMVLDGDNLGNAEVLAESGEQGFGRRPGSPPIEVRGIGLDALVAERSLAGAQVALVWSDTQGSEADVIETGVELWKSDVPLYAELWPRGLAAHGGSERFVRAACSRFRAFISRDALLGAAEPIPRPTGELGDLLASLPPGGYTDALLVP